MERLGVKPLGNIHSSVISVELTAWAEHAVRGKLQFKLDLTQSEFSYHRVLRGFGVAALESDDMICKDLKETPQNSNRN